MKVGDLVSVVYDQYERENGTMLHKGAALVVDIEGGHKNTEECLWATPWVTLNTGDSFRSDKLEVISEGR